MGERYAYKELEFVPGMIVKTVYGHLGVVKKVVLYKQDYWIDIYMLESERMTSYKLKDVFVYHGDPILSLEQAATVVRIRLTKK